MALRWPRLTIRIRLVAATAILLAASAAAPILVLPARLEAHSRAELEMRAVDIARAFGGASEVALDFSDSQRAGEVLRGFGAAEGARYARLAHADGRQLATWGRPPSSGLPSAATAPSVRYGQGLLHVEVTVLTPSGERGALQAGFDLEALHRRRSESRGLVITTAAAVFGLGVLAWLFIAASLTKPVRALAAVAERIAQGDEKAATQLETARQDEAGAVAVALGTVVERLAAQRAMLQSQSEATSEGILTLDLEGRVITHNRRFAEIWSVPRASVEGARWRDVESRLREASCGGWPEWLSDGAPRLPGAASKSFPLDLGGGRAVTVYAATVRMPDGAPLGLGLYFHDITREVQDRRRIEELAQQLERRVEERTRELAKANEELGRRIEDLRRAQEQLVIADRRISLGRLSAGVAHEINNPLAYLLANVQSVIKDLQRWQAGRQPETGAPARAAIEEMLEALGDAVQGADRVAHIVRGLKAFSRGDDDRRERVRLERSMAAALDMAGHEIRHRARLVQQIGEVPAVEANEVRLSQVFLNLLLNAAQAIPLGAAHSNAIAVSLGTDKDGWAYAEVRDSGCGIPAEIRGRIFDPFFTTKPQGEGSGLGLSISLGIVTSLGGTIEVESEPGNGSAFRVRLPPASGGAAPTPVPPAAPELPRSRLLLLDDDAMVASGLRRLLRPGHEVVVVADGRDALDMIRGGERFDHILCDLMMPGMTGMEFYTELGTLCPQQASTVIFMSGGVFTEESDAFVAEHRDRFVRKPLDLEELRRVIHGKTLG